MTYRSRYIDDVQLGTVIDLILVDETNPRSVSFQAAQLAEHIDRLPNSQNKPLRTVEQRIVLNALTRLRLLDLESLASLQTGNLQPLIDLLTYLDQEMLNLSDALSIAYFSHATQPRLLARRHNAVKQEVR